MKFIETFREGMHVSDVYLCKTKQIALTKNGKEYNPLHNNEYRMSVAGATSGKIFQIPAG